MTQNGLEQINFASQADRDAWELDFAAFGAAIVDEHGKHVPLKDMPLLSNLIAVD